MLYIFTGNNENEDFVTRSLPFLSSQRTERLNALKPISDKVNCCAAYLLLRFALYHEYGIAKAPVFGFEEREKPFLADTPGIFFNLSHCRNAAACILSHSRTAVDIMDLRKLHSSVHKRVCSEEELAFLEGSKEQDLDFLKLWTRKECFSKLTGRGLETDFRTITDSLPELEHIHTFTHDNFIISFYSESPEESTVFLSAEKLLDLVINMSKTN